MPCDDDCTHSCLKEVRVQSKVLKLHHVEHLCHALLAQQGVQAAAVLIPGLLLSLGFAESPGLEMPMSTWSQNCVRGFENSNIMLLKDMLVSEQKQSTLCSPHQLLVWNFADKICCWKLNLFQMFPKKSGLVEWSSNKHDRFSCPWTCLRSLSAPTS